MHMLTVTLQGITFASLSIQNVAASDTVHVYCLFDISLSAPYIYIYIYIYMYVHNILMIKIENYNY
jgi:hypothetical protein